jgi:spermidine synthase
VGSPIRIRFLHRVWSFLEPVTLAEATSSASGRLELRLVRNRVSLRTDGALYSDGKRYLPAVTLANHLGDGLSALRSVLVLGVGVASIVRVLRARGCHPRYTLVEKDRTILRWAMETLGAEGRRADPVEPCCADAEAFMAQNQREFDLIFVDLFIGRQVPAFATALPFLQRCRDGLAPGGRVVLNYLAEDEQKWRRLHEVLCGIFPGGDLVSLRDNRIFITPPRATGG